jgi:hypothetical protein
MSSEDELYGEARANADAGYKEMADAYAPPPKEEEKTFGDDMDSLKDVASELTGEREERHSERPIVDRKYVQYGGSNHGEAVPDNQTISIERTADDLTRQRGFEADAAEDAKADLLSRVVDVVRGDQPQPAEQQQQYEQPQVEAQTQPQPVADLPDGVDVELVEEVQRASPKLKAALSEEAARVEQAPAAYGNAAEQAAKLGAASILAAFPELTGLRGEELPAAIKVIGQSNPEARSIVSHLNEVGRIWSAAEQARAQQAQQQQAQQDAQLRQWAAHQDAQVDQHLKTLPPNVVKETISQFARIAESVYGIKPAELRQAVLTQPVLRSAPMQRIILDAARFHLAQESLKEHRSNPVPQVQRPGVGRDIGSDNDDYVAGLERQLQKSGDIKVAAKLLLAQCARRNS